MSGGELWMSLAWSFSLIWRPPPNKKHYLNLTNLTSATKTQSKLLVWAAASRTLVQSPRQAGGQRHLHLLDSKWMLRYHWYWLMSFSHSRVSRSVYSFSFRAMMSAGLHPAEGQPFPGWPHKAESSSLQRSNNWCCRSSAAKNENKVLEWCSGCL